MGGPLLCLLPPKGRQLIQTLNFAELEDIVKSHKVENRSEEMSGRSIGQRFAACGPPTRDYAAEQRRNGRRTASV